VISVLANHLVDFYLSKPTGKELWDVLEANFGATDAGSELYVMEKFSDYKMVDDRLVVEQAHEIHTLEKELEGFKCELPDKFVVGIIISKLQPTWRDFATSLKHKRKLFSVTDLIGSLDVEEKARAKDTRGKEIVGASSANFVQKKNNFSNSHSKKKNNKPENVAKTKQTTTFKKKKKNDGNCYVCRQPVHFAAKCSDPTGAGKIANMVIGETVAGTSGYGNYLPTFLSVCSSPELWIDTRVNIHVCVDVFFFSFYQVGGTTSLLMGNESHERVLGVGTVDLKLTSGKTV
jgi:hypothetical protein